MCTNCCMFICVLYGEHCPYALSGDGTARQYCEYYEPEEEE